MDRSVSIEAEIGLLAMFREMASTHAGRTALSAEGRRYTYRELDAWSDRIGQLLKGRGVRQGDRVALRMLPGAEAIAAMIGVLKAGAAYVPLDVRHPSARRSFILADSESTVLIGDPGEGHDTASVAVIAESEIAALAEGPTGEPLTVVDDASAEAYVIYTSGTTGTPKGVPVQHRHAGALFTAAGAAFEFDERDRWLLFHSLAFDFSVWEIWGALTTGAELVVLPHWAARSPEKYLQVIVDAGVTVLSQTPTAFTALAAAALRSEHDLAGLRYVVFGGEKLVPATLHPWAKRYGLEQPRLVNGYGITETTVFTTFHEVGTDDLASNRSVIGTALPGFRLRVVDENGRDVEDGEAGELWLAGPQVTDGYLKRPDLTADKYPLVTEQDTGEAVRYYRSGDLVTRLPDGALAYIGRADLQVKLRGYRIELSDIEAVVRTHPGVLDAVVQVREFKAGDDRLVCAFVARDEDGAPDAADLRRHVKDQLPAYMQPARYLRLPELPSTVNGKVDRAAVARSWNETAVNA